MTKQINEARGKAQEIELVAEATAKGVKLIAAALNAEGGAMAANLRVAEQYVKEFGKLAKESNTMLIPTNMGDMAGMVATAMSIVGKTKSVPSGN